MSQRDNNIDLSFMLMLHRGNKNDLSLMLVSRRGNTLYVSFMLVSHHEDITARKVFYKRALHGQCLEALRKDVPSTVPWDFRSGSIRLLTMIVLR